MIDFPIAALFDDSLCLLWLEQQLHPTGFVCPHGGSSDRRIFPNQQSVDAYRCRSCDGYYTLFTGSVFEAYLHLYVATYEALVTAKQVSPILIYRMCWPPKEPPHAYWA
jgi:hypothetical protein